MIQVSPVVCTSTYLPTSSVCVIQCNGGYGIVGNNTRECLADGSWSNALRGTTNYHLKLYIRRYNNSCLHSITLLTNTNIAETFDYTSQGIPKQYVSLIVSR